MKTKRFQYVKIVFLVVFLFFLPLLLTAITEQGELRLSFWNRSYFYGQESNRPNRHENILRFDLTQNIRNYGKFTAWIDALNTDSGNGGRISQFRLQWRDLKIGSFTLNSTLGDRYLQFSNLESRFTNTIYPFLYLRGGSVQLSASRLEAEIWAGRNAQLAGLLGSTYELKEQSLFGFRAGYQWKDPLLVGLGYIHSGQEKDALGDVRSEKNDVFLLDSEFHYSHWLRILGEFKRSSSLVKKGKNRENGSYFKLGPIVRTDKVDFEANYRFIGSQFWFVNQGVQVEQDESGLFSTLRYKPNRTVTLFSSLDSFRDNVNNDPQRNTVNNLQTFSGLSLYPDRLPSFMLRLDYGKRKSRGSIPDIIDTRSSGLYTQIAKNWKNFYPYLRYRYHKAKNNANPEGTYSSSTIDIGLRHTFQGASTLWLEGAWDRRFDYLNIKTRNKIRFRAGLRKNFTRNLSLHSEAIYHKTSIQDEEKRLELYLGINYNLPWDVGLRVDFRSNTPIGSETQGSNYWFTIKLNKRLQWGAPSRVLGRVSEEGVLGMGGIQGIVFEDLNQNSIKDSNESGLSGVKVTLEDGSLAVTNEQGIYRFNNVAAGNHQLSLDVRRIPAQYYILDPVPKNVMVNARKTVRADFVYISGSSLSGQVWEDSNRNGKADPDDKGMADILVLLRPVTAGKEPGELRYIQDMALNTYTDLKGKYSFKNILPGEYEISLAKDSLPEGAEVQAPLILKVILLPGEKTIDKNFLIKPRPIIIRKK